MHHNIVVITTKLNSGFARVQIQPTTCQRSAMVKISENSPAGNKAKHLSSINNPAKTIHQCAQIRLILEAKFCFSTWVFFHEYWRFTGQLEKRDTISLSPLYHFHLVHRHLGISQEIIAKNSTLYLETFDFVKYYPLDLGFFQGYFTKPLL